MEISGEQLQQVRFDLGIYSTSVRGQKTPVRRCWHFFTKGDAVDSIFFGDEDFLFGMNRIFLTVRRYKVIVLAFCLMDTHLHFILYGSCDECVRFMHEYLRRTSMFISAVHGSRKSLADIPVSHQAVTDGTYLKTAICYVLKNPPVAGLPYTALNYPWSSGSLYFSKKETWASPSWMSDGYFVPKHIGSREGRVVFRTNYSIEGEILVHGNFIFPGEYVAYGLVEELFRTCKSFNYFLCSSREADVEAREETMSMMSMPIRELRQHRDEIVSEVFKVTSLRNLNMRQRLVLAKKLKSRYGCSARQVCRVCGLVYDDVKTFLP